MADARLAALRAEIKANLGKFYVYVLKRPDGAPFYIGLGKAQSGVGQRIFQHEYLANGSGKEHRHNIIRKIWRCGEVVSYEIDSWHNSQPGAAAREVELIATLGRSDLGTGPLANKTAGGDGAPDLSPESKAISSRKISASNRARFADPLERAKQSERTKNYFLSNPEALIRLMEQSRAASSTPEAVAKFLDRTRAHNADPVAKAARVAKATAAHINRSDLTAAATRKQFSDPLQRQAASDRAKRQMSTPEARKAHSEKLKKKFAADPSWPQKMSSRFKRMWADPQKRSLLEEHARQKFGSDEFKKAQSERVTARFSDPSERKAQSERIRAANKRRTAIMVRCLVMLARMRSPPQTPKKQASISDWLEFEERLKAMPEAGVSHDGSIIEKVEPVS